MSSDDRLALRAARGDRRAFAAIYERYHQDLYRFCLAMVGNPHDAKDALQNTMVKVLRALPGEKRQIKLKPWLYRIARNESIEILRSRRDDAELEPEQVAGTEVAETAATRDRLRVLLADLERLPERQRAALVMRELSDLDFAEIGAAFGSSAAVARQTLYEARLSLRQLEAGREMPCADVMRELSDADGRVTRRREIQAHLRGCADCRAFRESIEKRQENLASLAPLPIAASAGLLHGALGQAGKAAASAGNGLTGTVGAGAGKTIAASAVVKSAAAVAVVAVVGVSAAGRSGLIDVPLAGDSGHAPAQSTAGPDGTADGGDSGANSTSTGAIGTPLPGSAGGAGEQSGGGTHGEDGGGHQGGGAARDGVSSSQAGLSPPGGGYGRSASERHGRPERLPEAAGHGQQTAAVHKPAHNASPPAQSASGGDHGESPEAGGAPSAKSTPSAKPGAPATAPQAPQPSDEAPPREKGGSAETGSSATPPGREP
jgi:RNA polymerase sigma factor (sigma-70 family)